MIGIIHIDMDVPNLEELEKHFEEEISDGMDKLAEEIEWAWRAEAGRTLHESKEKYLKGLKVENFMGEIQVTLTGLGAGIELGQEPYSLKPGFLTKKGLTHRIIPMGFPPASPANPRFRTITTNSPGWIHPGFGENRSTTPKVGKRVIEKIEEEIIPEVFDRLIGEIKI